MDLSLFFAGTGGSVPGPRRGLPAILMRRGADRILFDCGEGTQRQLIRSVGLPDLDTLFITHFHADHWLGLPGMLKSFTLRDRDLPLKIYGPPGLRELMDRTRFIYGRLSFDVMVSELEPDERVGREGYEIAAVAARHKNAVAIGYAIVEDDRPGRFDAALAQRLGVKPGPDFGRLQRGETVSGVRPEQVMGPVRAGRRIVISGDTAPCEGIAAAARGADLLVHEATFLDTDRERAALTGHSTALQAATVAQKAGVRCLALVHLSARYSAREVQSEARERFADTEVPRDFDAIEVPFPERGQPHLIRWADRSSTAPESDTENTSAEPVIAH